MSKTYDLILKADQGPSIEEALDLVREAKKNGFDSVNITGDEPFGRKDIIKLVKAISEEGPFERFTITTDGQKLADHAESLKNLGITQVIVKASTFKYMAYHPENEDDTLEAMVEGINACVNAEIKPVRLLMKVEAGVNDMEILDFVQLTLMHDYEVVFIPTESFTEEQIMAKLPAARNVPGGMEGLEVYKYPGAVGKLCFPRKSN